MVWGLLQISYPMSSSPSFKALRSTVLVGILFGGAVQADTITWNGGGADNLWSNADNWNGATADSGDLLTFVGANRLDPFNDLTGASFTGLRFSSNAGSFALNGNSITMTGNLTNNAVAPQTINMEMLFSKAASIFSMSGSNLTIAAPISGFFPLTFDGAGTTRLTAENPYNAATVVQNGGLLHLDFSAAGAPANNILADSPDPAPLTIRQGAAMKVTGKDGASNSQSFSGSFVVGGNTEAKGGGTLIVTAGSGGTMTLNLGTFTASSSSINDGASLGIFTNAGATINAKSPATAAQGIYTSKIVWNGQDWATSVGNGDPDHPYTMTAFNGYTAYDPASNAGNTVNALLTSSATMDSPGEQVLSTLKIAPTGPGQSLSITAGKTISLFAGNGAGILFTGAEDFTINSVGTGSRGRIRTTGGGQLTLQAYGTGVLTIDANVGSNQSAGLLKAGPGTVVLSAPNQYAGLTYINEGVLSVSTNRNLGAQATSANATIIMSGGTLRSTGTFTLQDDSVTPIARNIAIHGGGATLDVTDANVLTVSGVVQNGSGNGKATSVGALVKAGLGTLVYTGVNTFSGTTTIDEGTILINAMPVGTRLTGNTLMPNTTSSYIVNDGGVLGGIAGTGDAGVLGGSVTVNSGGMILGGDGISASGALAVVGNLLLGEDSIVELVLGPSGAHSSLARNGTGNWTFDDDQLFHFLSATAGTYDNVITGLASDPGTTLWQVANSGFSGLFTYDGSGNIDLTLSAIPEPGVCALLGLGALAAVGGRLRRKS